MVETGEHQEVLFFGELLKAFRQQKKLTQQQLAARLEVTRETVSLWERGNYKPEAEGILCWFKTHTNLKFIDKLSLSSCAYLCLRAW